MHSSCIVVLLDWAAGLPAWLIRRFGSPDLTRTTLFTSQKHQNHSSWALNGDSWLTLSMNIYQLYDTAGRCTNLAVHQSYWQNLARSMPSVPFCCFSSRATEKQVNDKTITILLRQRSSQAGWKTKSPNFLSVLVHLASNTSTYICYTGLILYQCNAHPVFVSKLLKQIRMLVRFVTFLHESSPLRAHSVRHVLVIVCGHGI